jgi:type 1 fimbria pilin
LLAVAAALLSVFMQSLKGKSAHAVAVPVQAPFGDQTQPIAERSAQSAAFVKSAQASGVPPQTNGQLAGDSASMNNETIIGLYLLTNGRGSATIFPRSPATSERGVSVRNRRVLTAQIARSAAGKIRTPSRPQARQ